MDISELDRFVTHYYEIGSPEKVGEALEAAPWADFHGSGDRAPVRRIIDVLERPDELRERLEAYLTSPPRGWIKRWLRRRRLKKLEALGVVLEPDRRGIASIQDLDCHCSTRGFDPSAEAWAAHRKLLAFLPEKPPTEAMMKATARWSLARNARQHEWVLEVCEEEAAKRTGRVRAALLEIVAHAHAGRKDPARALGALQESLDPDPGRRAGAEAALSVVMDLPVRPVDAQQFSARGAAVTLTACRDATEQTTSYCSKVVLQRAGESTEDGGPTYWELHAIRPDKHRVRRIAGSELDEWVTIGSRHFRGPTFMDVEPGKGQEAGVGHEAGERRETAWLLLDKYLAVLGSADPVALEERDAGSHGYHVVEYGPDAVRSVIGTAGGRVPPGSRTADAEERLRLWLDAETKRLVRAEWTFAVDGPVDGRQRYRVVQGFAAYDRAPDVVPPPFQLFVVAE